MEARQEWTEEAAERWREDARVDFSGHVFEEGTRFSAFTFPGDVSFETAVFPTATAFRGTTFHGAVHAPYVRFSQDVDFTAVAFKGPLLLSRSTVGGRLAFSACSFEDEAVFVGLRAAGACTVSMGKFRKGVCFEDASFDEGVAVRHAACSGEASFRGAVFSGPLRLDNCTFDNAAIFQWASCDGAFACDGCAFDGYISFQGSRFSGACTFSTTSAKSVPVFVECHFNEPPTLVGIEGLDSRDAGKGETGFGEVSMPARWRALRTIAHRSGDDEKALRFFAAEVRSRRGLEDRACFPSQAQSARCKYKGKDGQPGVETWPEGKCPEVRSNVIMEWERHQPFRVRPAEHQSQHSLGVAFDANWGALADGVGIDGLAHECGACRPVPGDCTHFETGSRCPSAPQTPADCPAQ